MSTDVATPGKKPRLAEAAVAAPVEEEGDPAGSEGDVVRGFEGGEFEALDEPAVAAPFDLSTIEKEALSWAPGKNEMLFRNVIRGGMHLRNYLVQHLPADWDNGGLLELAAANEKWFNAKIPGKAGTPIKPKQLATQKRWLQAGLGYWMNEIEKKIGGPGGIAPESKSKSPLENGVDFLKTIVTEKQTIDLGIEEINMIFGAVRFHYHEFFSTWQTIEYALSWAAAKQPRVVETRRNVALKFVVDKLSADDGVTSRAQSITRNRVLNAMYDHQRQFNGLGPAQWFGVVDDGGNPDYRFQADGAENGEGVLANAIKKLEDDRKTNLYGQALWFHLKDSIMYDAVLEYVTTSRAGNDDTLLKVKDIIWFDVYTSTEVKMILEKLAARGLDPLDDGEGGGLGRSMFSQRLLDEITERINNNDDGTLGYGIDSKYIKQLVDYKDLKIKLRKLRRLDRLAEAAAAETVPSSLSSVPRPGAVVSLKSAAAAAPAPVSIPGDSKRSAPTTTISSPPRPRESKSPIKTSPGKSTGSPPVVAAIVAPASAPAPEKKKKKPSKKATRAPQSSIAEMEAMTWEERHKWCSRDETATEMWNSSIDDFHDAPPRPIDITGFKAGYDAKRATLDTPKHERLSGKAKGEAVRYTNVIYIGWQLRVALSDTGDLRARLLAMAEVVWDKGESNKVKTTNKKAVAAVKMNEYAVRFFDAMLAVGYPIPDWIKTDGVTTTIEDDKLRDGIIAGDDEKWDDRFKAFMRANSPGSQILSTYTRILSSYGLTYGGDFEGNAAALKNEYVKLASLVVFHEWVLYEANEQHVKDRDSGWKRYNSDADRKKRTRLDEKERATYDEYWEKLASESHGRVDEAHRVYYNISRRVLERIVVVIPREQREWKTPAEQDVGIVFLSDYHLDDQIARAKFYAQKAGEKTALDLDKLNPVEIKQFNPLMHLYILDDLTLFPVQFRHKKGSLPRNPLKHPLSKSKMTRPLFELFLKPQMLNEVEFNTQYPVVHEDTARMRSLKKAWLLSEYRLRCDERGIKAAKLKDEPSEDYNDYITDFYDNYQIEEIDALEATTRNNEEFADLKEEELDAKVAEAIATLKKDHKIHFELSVREERVPIELLVEAYVAAEKAYRAAQVPHMTATLEAWKTQGLLLAGRHASVVQLHSGHCVTGTPGSLMFDIMMQSAMSDPCLRIPDSANRSVLTADGKKLADGLTYNAVDDRSVVRPRLHTPGFINGMLRCMWISTGGSYTATRPFTKADASSRYRVFATMIGPREAMAEIYWEAWQISEVVFDWRVALVPMMYPSRIFEDIAIARGLPVDSVEQKATRVSIIDTIARSNKTVPEFMSALEVGFADTAIETLKTTASVQLHVDTIMGILRESTQGSVILDNNNMALKLNAMDAKIDRSTVLVVAGVIKEISARVKFVKAKAVKGSIESRLPDERVIINRRIGAALDWDGDRNLPLVTELKTSICNSFDLLRRENAASIDADVPRAIILYYDRAFTIVRKDREVAVGLIGKRTYHLDGVLVTRHDGQRSNLIKADEYDMVVSGKDAEEVGETPDEEGEENDDANSDIDIEGSDDDEGGGGERKKDDKKKSREYGSEPEAKAASDEAAARRNDRRDKQQFKYLKGLNKKKSKYLMDVGPDEEEDEEPVAAAAAAAAPGEEGEAEEDEDNDDDDEEPSDEEGANSGDDELVADAAAAAAAAESAKTPVKRRRLRHKTASPPEEVGVDPVLDPDATALLVAGRPRLNGKAKTVVVVDDSGGDDDDDDEVIEMDANSEDDEKEAAASRREIEADERADRDNKAEVEENSNDDDDDDALARKEAGEAALMYEEAKARFDENTRIAKGGAPKPKPVAPAPIVWRGFGGDDEDPASAARRSEAFRFE